MTEAVIYERALPEGAVVRIRKTSQLLSGHVTGVLEVDRRAGTARASDGVPPPLATAEAASDDDLLTRLRPMADDDAEIARLLHARGLR